MTIQKRWWACTALLLSAVLAGCGGGDEADKAKPEDTTGRVPASATASVEAFTGFVGSQAPSERAQPLSLQGTVPPTSETTEPLPLG